MNAIVKASPETDRADERVLVARAQSGDEGAIRALIRAHKDRLFAFIWRMVRNEHDAEEVCQDAFLKAFASLHTFSSEYRFSTWLFTIGYRVCLNRMRKRSVLSGELDTAQLSAASDESGADRLASKEATELRGRVWEAVDRLSDAQRAAVVLFYRHEMSCQEIARVLEVPVATVKSHLHRARARLRELLETVEERDIREFRNRAAGAG
ncbi:MAG: sigma-70 family RNA polymerase sigma factor [Phycisphaerae bacterium]|nr:sigma-70 family RNA polymerase sigma factor [Phycisphaerae bacterium]